MAIELRAMRYFMAVAEQKSFSRAAEQLHVAQPALSLQVRGLEEQLGTTLFLRKPRGVELTPSGERFLDHAHAVLRRLDAACEDMRATRDDPVGLVTLSMPQSLAKLLTVPVVRTALARWPNAQLRLLDLSTGFVPEFILSERIDLGMMFQAPPDPAIHARHLLDEELLVVGPPGRFPRLDAARWNRNARVPFREVARMPLILPMRMHSLRELVEDYARSRRLRLRVVLDVNAVPQLIDLAAAGVGCTLLSYPSVRSGIERGEISAARIESPQIARPVYLCRSATARSTHAATAMEGLLVQSIGEIVAAGGWPARLASPR